MRAPNDGRHRRFGVARTEEAPERERKTLGQLISELLAKAIESENDTTEARPFRWVTRDLQPRVDIEDKDALWSVLDER